MKMWTLVIAITLALPAVSYAACSGSSPSLTAPTWGDLAACHTAANNGDTITITPGSYTASAVTAITKYVIIVGTGVSVTDNIPGDHNYMLDVTESTAGSTKFSGIGCVQGTGPEINSTGACFGVTRATGGKPVLATANTCTVGTGGNCFYWSSNQGVIWANTMTATRAGGSCLGNASFVRHKVTGLTSSWTTPSTFGSADTTGNGALYIENNEWVNAAEGTDSDDNARTVIRYNRITNSGLTLHGVDTSGVEGARYVEFYNNTFILDETLIAACSNQPANVTGWIGVRGGTTLIHHNVIPDINGYWGPHQGIAFNVEELRRNAGGFPCWGTTTMPGTYPAPKQTGWGYISGGTTITATGCPGCPITVRQDSEPVYLWSNTGGGNYDAPGLVDFSPDECGGGPSIGTYVQSGRDYFTSTQKPGYTAFRYPHPLTGLICQTDCGVSPVSASGNTLWRGNILVR